jgi:hypothetical protein
MINFQGRSVIVSTKVMNIANMEIGSTASDVTFLGWLSSRESILCSGRIGPVVAVGLNLDDLQSFGDNVTDIGLPLQRLYHRAADEFQALWGKSKMEMDSTLFGALKQPRVYLH